MFKPEILAYNAGIGQKLDIIREAKVTKIYYNTVANFHKIYNINSDIKMFCTIITINIGAYVYVTAVNVTKYAIILISVIIGMGGGG